MTKAYDYGDAPRLAIAFTDINGNADDPTTITFKVKWPDGTTETFVYGTDAEIVKTATGAYYIELSLSQWGRVLVQWKGTGNLEALQSYELWVRRPEV